MTDEDETYVDEEEDPNPWEGYESGPFCRHYSDPSDCKKICTWCGHGCTDHGWGDGSPPSCNEDNCDCEAWEEADDDGR